MAECMELLNPAALEEQQEELTVLQSIFEDDLQLLQEGDGQGNISFNLTVKVNIPFERIDFEAFIPIPGEVGVEERSTIRSRTDSNDELGNDRKDDEENATSTVSEGHPDAQENGTETSASSNNENENLSETSTNSFAGRRKPGFSRSLSRKHWHVRADIQYLTPMHLTCTFPSLYPTECPPEFSLSCLWLTRNQIQILQDKLMSLWTETPYLPIVFTWADWLQNYAYEYLRLGSHLVLKDTNEENQELDQSEALGTKLQTALLTIFEYDLEMQRQVFRQSTHLCEICFDERDGAEFHYLDECKHFFCNDCLKAHCEMHVEGGTVLNLLCPNHDCKTTIPPEILRDVLDADKLERWERLLLSKTLDVMGDVVYCPRCNVAVVVDEDESSRLGHCANCFFAFCTECHEPWHARQECFEGETDSEDEESAKNKNANSKKKKEKKDGTGDGKAELSLRRQQKLQREKERRKEMSNLSFIRLMKQQGNYQYCPKCRMAVERVSGCDMMHCSQCRAAFCWRCGKAISGYDHFGNCGRVTGILPPRQREPTVGETLIEEYKKANPRKLLRTKFCPRCHQKCLKENSNNNHIKCWACRTNFCYQCGKEIKGAVTMHFTAASSCAQHSDD
ncbi:hypothetical protein ACROYT_G008683 [Oculina patagonica]